MSPSAFAVWPVLVYGGLVLLLVAGMVALSHFLGERHRAPGRDDAYESGVDPVGSARLRYGVKYYLVAIFFLIFDVEAAIIFAWAVAARELGWAGYTVAVLFMATLVIGLVYAWKLGGLDWAGTETRPYVREAPLDVVVGPRADQGGNQ